MIFNLESVLPRDSLETFLRPRPRRQHFGLGLEVNARVINTSSAVAVKLHDACRGQSKSPNMVPFHMLGMVSY